MTHPKFCPGTRICCPTCGGILPYQSVHEGYGFYQCARKVGEGHARRTCSQHVLYYAMHRLVGVISITTEQRQRFDGHDVSLSLHAMLAEIGVAVADEREPQVA